MTSENNYQQGKPSAENEKKTWVKPAITPIEHEKIRQEEVELYYRMMEDPEIFQRLADSGGGSAG